MRVSKPGRAVTAISTADEQSITVRNHDLARDLIGVVSFTEFFFLHVTGHRPTENQRFFLDALLVSIAEHGLTHTVLSARMTFAAAPDAMQAAVAAGVLGCGTVVLGTAELCARLLARAAAEAEGKPAAERDAIVLRLARDIHARGERLPGFGHPLHKPVDPRSVRLLALADQRGAAGIHVDLLRRLDRAAATVWGKPLVLNVSAVIAAILLDLNFPESAVKGIPILARTAGLIGHLAEERETPIGFYMAGKAEEAITYVGGTADTARS
jgi:citrate synthase